MSNKIHVGGQAVIEGVMMRTPGSLTVAVRRRNGEIKIKQQRLVSVMERIPLLGKPFFRGVVVLAEAMINGMQALSYSAQQYIEDETGDDGNSQGKTPGLWTMVPLIAFGVGMGILIFVVLPHLLTALLGRVIHVDMGVETVRFHLVDGGLKLSFFVLYLWAISLMKDVRRVFQYHGAEHKSIHAYEAGRPLTMESAMSFTTLHQRCGTAFILLVLSISILLFAVVFPLVPGLRALGTYATHLAVVGAKILFFIPLAGISYEVIKLGDRYPHNFFLKAFIRPGLWLQRLTTREPTADQVEVALAALKSALEMERTRVNSPSQGGRDA